MEEKNFTVNYGIELNEIQPGFFNTCPVSVVNYFFHSCLYSLRVIEARGIHSPFFGILLHLFD